VLEMGSLMELAPSALYGPNTIFLFHFFPKIFAPTFLMMQNMQLERDDDQIQVIAVFLIVLGGHRISNLLSTIIFSFFLEKNKGRFTFRSKSMNLGPKRPP
jgi:uncharacterized membrane protein